MKKIFILIVMIMIGVSTMFAQNIGVSLENTMWNGDFISNVYPTNIENTNSNNSVILGLNYYYTLSENLDVVGSAGYAFGFEVIPLKANFNYKISDKIYANFGMGIYMISDSIYTNNSIGIPIEGTEERTTPSTNEFGLNFGMSYKLTSAIALTGNYNSVKNDGNRNFNGLSFGLSYTIGKNKRNNTKEAVKQVYEKQPIVISNSNSVEKDEKENKELLEKLKQANLKISTQSLEVNTLSSALGSKEKELKLAQNKLTVYEERSIKLEMKQYLGMQLPVFNTYSFSSAFSIAANKYGSSRDQKFWWNKKVYTTEMK